MTVNSLTYDETIPAGQTPRQVNQFDGDDATWAVAATEPRHIPPRPVPRPPRPEEPSSSTFWPTTPQEFEQTGLRPSQVEALILKFILNLGAASGREIAAQICLPFTMTHALLVSMKDDQLLSLRSDAPLGDYHYELTEFGMDRARRHVQQCTYFGAAPVPLDQYATAVAAQSPRNEPVRLPAVEKALKNLVISSDLTHAIGEALNMGCGLFLYGAPGNGKSTVAERLSQAFSRTIWIPRAISAGGEIVRLFDSIHHQPVEPEGSDADRPFDRRWVRIVRPTISVGGELDLSSFDVSTNPLTGISEAPLQLKANCGTLVVDDFGRNRFRPEELLNRLVVPLERRIDSLHLKSGRTFRIPFDCMLVFSSNLQPQDLVDEAFLRRIPYKIDVANPTEEQFLELFARESTRLKVQLDPNCIDELLSTHYRAAKRPVRFCHARDLLQMVANACDFRGVPRVMTHENLNAAAHRYFAQ